MLSYPFIIFTIFPVGLPFFVIQQNSTSFTLSFYWYRNGAPTHGSRVVAMRSNSGKLWLPKTAIRERFWVATDAQTYVYRHFDYRLFPLCHAACHVSSLGPAGQSTNRSFSTHTHIYIFQQISSCSYYNQSMRPIFVRSSENRQFFSG